MKCQVCGAEAKIVQEFDSDGLKKRVAFCKRCFRKTITGSAELDEEGIAKMYHHAEIVQESLVSYHLETHGSHLEVFVSMPVAVLSTLFEKDVDTEEKMRKEMYMRELVILKDRLKRAVEREDYTTASAIKKRIQRLEEILKM